MRVVERKDGRVVFGAPVLPRPPVEIRLDELETVIAATRRAGQIATRQLIRDGLLSEDEIAALVSLYPGWEPGREYAVGDLLAYTGRLYEVVQAHTSQEGWEPDTTPALFKSHTPEGVIAEWVQPAGAHDAYPLGAKVIHNGKVWVSVVDNNVWEPGALAGKSHRSWMWL